MIDIHLHGDVAEIVLANPPVNALSASARRALAQAVSDAQSNPAIKAIVIRGSGRLFSAGADITEFGEPLVEPNLPEVIDAIEASSIPVVAAIHGSALGGGLEIALGCHYRIAAVGSKLGLPEVLLGLLPGAGGTQRLPRLIGAEDALEMIVLGHPISAERALILGLVDRLARDEQLLAENAIAFARTLDKPRRTGERKVSAEPGLFERFAADKARQIKDLDAPRACIDAVKAASQLPLEQGMEIERMLFGQLVNGEQAQALRHIFFAERSAAKIEGLEKDLELRPVTRAGVIGAGTMGGGIAMNFLSAGIPVTLIELQQDALARGVAIIRKNYEASAAKGRITSRQVDMAMGLLTPSLDFAAVAGCDLVIEAVYEDLELKKEIFARLDMVAKKGAILASNTSFLSIDEIASVTERPEDVIGLHFFSPANVMKLLEVVRGARTAPEVLATSMDLARRIGKVPVVSGVCHGFIGNRMLTPRQDNAEALALEGAAPEQIDRVHTGFGMPMGPFQMADLAGLDIGWHRNPERVETLLEAFCAEGRWGQKTKAGYYDYDDDRRSRPSAAATSVIAGDRRQGNYRAHALHDGERGREDPRGKYRAARVRHRCGVDQRLWLAASQGRPHVLGQSRRPRRDSRRSLCLR